MASIVVREANMDELGGGTPLGWPDDYRMTRQQASAFALAHGIKIAVNTLAKLAVRGDGPPMNYFGARPYYVVGEFRQWLVDRQRRARSTSNKPRRPEKPARKPPKPPSGGGKKPSGRGKKK
jgi:hypothetical protein